MSQISINQLHVLTGCSYRTVKRRCECLKAIKGPKNSILYDSTKALKAILAPEPSEDGKLDLNDAKARLVTTQEEKTSLEVQSRKGELLEADEIKEDFSKLHSMVVGAMKTLPGRVSKEIARLNDPGEIRARLLKEVNIIRGELYKSVYKWTKSIE